MRITLAAIAVAAGFARLPCYLPHLAAPITDIVKRPYFDSPLPIFIIDELLLPIDEQTLEAAPDSIGVLGIGGFLKPLFKIAPFRIDSIELLPRCPRRPYTA